MRRAARRAALLAALGAGGVLLLSPPPIQQRQQQQQHQESDAAQEGSGQSQVGKGRGKGGEGRVFQIMARLCHVFDYSSLVAVCLQGADSWLTTDWPSTAGGRWLTAAVLVAKNGIVEGKVDSGELVLGGGGEGGQASVKEGGEGSGRASVLVATNGIAECKGWAAVRLFGGRVGEGWKGWRGGACYSMTWGGVRGCVLQCWWQGTALWMARGGQWCVYLGGGRGEGGEAGGEGRVVLNDVGQQFRG